MHHYHHQELARLGLLSQDETVAQAYCRKFAGSLGVVERATVQAVWPGEVGRPVIKMHSGISLQPMRPLLHMGTWAQLTIGIVVQSWILLIG